MTAPTPSRQRPSAPTLPRAPWHTSRPDRIESCSTRLTPITLIPLSQTVKAQAIRFPEYRDRAAMGDSNLSDVLRRLGRPAEARDGYARAIAIREALVGEHPKVPLYRTNLAWSLRRRGLTLGDLGDPAAAAADARRAIALWDGLPARAGYEWFEAACAHAALAGLAGRGVGRRGRRRGLRGRDGDGPPAPGPGDGLPRGRGLPDGRGPRPAPRPP